MNRNRLLSPQFSLFIFLVIGAFALVGLNALAQGTVDPGVAIVDPVFAPPAWLESLVLYVKSLPYVGPVVVELGKWMGVVAAMLTGCALVLNALAKATAGLARFAKLPGLCEKITAFNLKAQPYLRYFSMYNVQKK